MSERTASEIRDARGVLDWLDEWMASRVSSSEIDRYEAYKLWDVLSALRSPDYAGSVSESLALKASTTMHVRSVAFPKLAQASKDKPFTADFETEVEAAFSKGKIGDHFMDHMRTAAIALGLKVGKG